MAIRILLVFLVLILSSCGHKAVNIHTRPAPPTPPTLENVHIALALGGGGSRGAAHAGVLSVLEENNIPIDLIVGSSAGSIIGALYADEPNAQILKQKLVNTRKWDVMDPNITNGFKMFWKASGFMDGHALKKYLLKNLHHHDFQNLKIPLAVVTTDVDVGKPYVIRSGPVIPAVHASSAIPVLFTPVQIYNRHLVDGGVMSPVPVEVARQLGAKHVIAVDIGDVIRPTQVTGSYQLVDRCLWLSYYALSNWQDVNADVSVKPKFDTTSMFDDENLEHYYQLGRQAAKEALPEIKKLLQD